MAQGRFRVLVLDGKTKHVVKDYGWRKNLILDSGLDRVCSSNTWQECFANCAVGTGTAIVMYDSVAAKATTVGTALTADGTAFGVSSAGFDNVDTGSLIHFDSHGASYDRYITYVDSDEVTLDQALPADITAPGDAFAVYRVNQTTLDTEFARATALNYLSGGCDSSYIGGKTTMWRTWDFPIISAGDGDQTFTELGWSWDSTPGGDLFSRAMISPSASVLVGQQLRIVYELNVSWGPITSTPLTPSITGWAATAGDYIMYGVSAINRTGIKYVTTSGGGDGASFLEPSTVDGQSIHLCTGSTLPALYTSSYSYGLSYGGSLSLGAYTPGSFTRNKAGYWDSSSGNSTSIRGLSLGSGAVLSPAPYGVVFVYDSAMSKDNLHTLSISWSIDVGRTLTNP